jgi:lipopolysaccharide/colanic/teichoic acid biosynthesis glycosyltransferase
MARLVEIIVALLFLVLLAPTLGLIALIVRLSSRGPVIVWEHRRDKYGNSICICQFRTSYVDPSRMTYFGRVLRQSSPKELPAFISLLRGDVNLGGFSDLMRRR